MKIRDSQNFITLLYKGLLNREPDIDGLRHYVGLLVEKKIPPEDILELFLSSDEYLSTKKEKLFAPAGHFYSPIVSRNVAERHFDKLDSKPIPRTLTGIQISLADMTRMFAKLVPYLKTIPFKEEKCAEFSYHFDNPAYGHGDGSVLYAMLRHQKPNRLIEIGSGWSSACALDTVVHYSLKTRLTFIEPHSALLEKTIARNLSKVELIKEPVQNVPPAFFKQLLSGDILFIDSTHILSTGSDVQYELFEILPILRSGVIVHFHDVFWPFEYPRTWAIEDNRSWNELYGLRAWLTNNHEWKVIFFNDYFAKFKTQLVRDTYPGFLINSGGAIWLQKQ